jgi:Flp pilus assembly protein TadD, contains TPR repeats
VIAFSRSSAIALPTPPSEQNIGASLANQDSRYKSGDRTNYPDCAALIDELNKRPSSVGYYILGNLFANLDYPNLLDPAVTAFQNAVKVDPSFAKAYERLGSVLARQKKSQEAEKAFRQAIQLDPNLSSAYRNLRDILHTQGKFDEAFLIFLAEQSMAE